MRMWEILLAFFCVGCLSIGLIIGVPNMGNHESRKQKRTDKNCLECVESYELTYQNYLLFKYDGRTVYDSEIMDANWIQVKEDCPELYKDHILPIKIKWDSIRFIPVEKTILEGVPSTTLDYKLRTKEIEKVKTRIKVKKSNGVDIENIQNSSVDDQYLINKDSIPAE